MFKDILLDMDGVVANFVQGLIDTHEWNITHEEYDSWNWHRKLMTDREMWAKTEVKDWWLNLKPYPWANELYSKLSLISNIIFCTSPNNDPECPSQKVKWLIKHNFMYNNNYQIGKKKELNAASGAILIDDSDDNIEKYREAGGKAILFPQPWNKNRDIKNPVDYVLKELN